jgi:hypothetical protein
MRCAWSMYDPPPPPQMEVEKRYLAQQAELQSLIARYRWAAAGKLPSRAPRPRTQCRLGLHVAWRAVEAAAVSAAAAGLAAGAQHAAATAPRP